MLPTFQDLGATAVLAVLVTIPFVVLGAVPLTMLLFLGLIVVTCIFCQSL